MNQTTYFQNGHRADTEPILMETEVFPLPPSAPRERSGIDPIVLLMLVEQEVKKTGRLDYPPFLESLQDNPRLQLQREWLADAVEQIRQAIVALETLLDKIREEPAPIESFSKAVANLAESTHFLEQYAYQCRFNTTPLHFPWPNRWAHSETKIRSRLNERLKAIRYYREVVYQFFVRTRKVHQTQRLRQSLKILLTSSQDAAMTLSEHNFFD